jgi:hypothetical protein
MARAEDAVFPEVRVSDKFIDKTRLNANRTTNATGLLSAASAIAAAWDGISHARSVAQWLPMVAIGMTSAIAQWLQGEPTPATKLIANVLRLDEGRTNADFLRDVFDRVFASGVVPGLESPGAGDDVGGPRSAARRGNALDAELLDRMADGSDYGDRGSMPAPAVRVAEDYFDRQRRNGRRLPNIPIAGTDITPERFSEISMGGIEDADGPRSEAW